MTDYDPIPTLDPPPTPVVEERWVPDPPDTPDTPAAPAPSLSSATPEERLHAAMQETMVAMGTQIRHELATAFAEDLKGVHEWATVEMGRMHDQVMELRGQVELLAGMQRGSTVPKSKPKPVKDEPDTTSDS